MIGRVLIIIWGYPTLKKENLKMLWYIIKRRLISSQLQYIIITGALPIIILIDRKKLWKILIKHLDKMKTTQQYISTVVTFFWIGKTIQKLSRNNWTLEITSKHTKTTTWQSASHQETQNCGIPKVLLTKVKLKWSFNWLACRTLMVFYSNR